MNVKIEQVEGLTFIAKGDSNHWVTIDGPEKFKGSEAASRPMELLLISLGSCTGSDVASILSKKRVKLSDFQINLSAERAGEHPKVFKKIDVEYVFYGTDLKETDLKRAIDLSEDKYCPVSAMLKKAGVKINYSYKIKDK
jgi:putative redox protein